MIELRCELCEAPTEWPIDGPDEVLCLPCWDRDSEKLSAARAVKQRRADKGAAMKRMEKQKREAEPPGRPRKAADA